MKIKTRTPLDRILGPFKEVDLLEPTSLGDLLQLLVKEKPELKPYAGFGSNDVQPYGLLVWRDAKLLTLSDTVNPMDDLEIIPMVAGG